MPVLRLSTVNMRALRLAVLSLALSVYGRGTASA